MYKVGNSIARHAILDYMRRAFALSGARLCVYNEHYILGRPQGSGAPAPLR